MEKKYKDIMQFAIERELDAYDFYTRAKKNAKTAEEQSLFDQLSKQELAHKQKLEAMRPSWEELINLSSLVMDDYTINESLPPDKQYHMEYQQILLLAMKKELLSVKLYTDMRRAVKDEERQKIFDMLIKEERAHGDILEHEYNTRVFSEY